ncbi:MAG: helix-turn-helix domain-containing protein [Planctomycetaceae bacterium]
MSASRRDLDRKRDSRLRAVRATDWLALFQLLPDVSFFVKDTRGRFIAMNRRGCEFCGVANERDVIGKTDFDFTPTRRAMEYVRDDREVLRTGRPLVGRIESAPEMEGSLRLVITSKIPLRDNRGRVIAIAGFSRLTDQVREKPAIERLGRVIERIQRDVRTITSTKQLADIACLSVSQLNRVFRRQLGTSAHKYLVQIRVESACRALAESNRKIAAIAHEFGFHDHAHFSKTFHNLYGITPTAYRRAHQRPELQDEAGRRSHRR